MLDPVYMLIQLALANGTLTGLVGQNVYGGALPEHFDPTSNPALVLSIAGGRTHSEMPLQDAVVQVKVWAGVNQFVLARSAYNAVFNALHGQTNVSFGSNGRLVSCLEAMPAQEVYDPDSGWATLVSHYQVIAVSTDAFAPTDAITPTQTVAQYVQQEIAALDDDSVVDGGPF